MWGMLGTALVLGIGGLDPTPALIAVAGLLVGASRRAVAALGLTVMIGAPMYGSILSLTIGDELSDVNWWVVVPKGQVGAIIGLAIGVVVLVFGVLRLVRPTREKTQHRHHATTVALVAAALTYVGSLVIDPTFVANTVLAGRAMRAGNAVLMQVAWVLLAQLPLLVLLITIARLGRQRAARDFQRVWAKVRPVVRWVITGALLLVGLVLAADAGSWFVTGHFLLADQSRRA